MAARALSNHPQRSLERVKQAEAVVAKLLERQSSNLAAMGKPLALWGMLGMITGGAAVFVAALA